MSPVAYWNFLYARHPNIGHDPNLPRSPGLPPTARGRFVQVRNSLSPAREERTIREIELEIEFVFRPWAHRNLLAWGNA